MHKTKKISLTRGQVATIDVADWPLVRAHTWHACSYGRNSWRAETTLRVNKRSIHIRLHRLLMGLTKGDGKCVDHINGDGLDNRRSNLRVCTRHENLCNRRKFVDDRTTSRYKGVSWHTKENKWRACVKVNGRQIELGHFDSEAKAAVVYNQAASKHFGTFARLNVI